MALKLNLGSAGNMDLSSDGDLAKYLQPGLDGLIHLDSKITDILDQPISQVPAGSVATSFNFSFTPSWKITQKVGIKLSVKPQASCKLTIIAPGKPIFTYLTGQEGTKNQVNGANNLYYVAIEMATSLALDLGASYSSGDFGVSADIADSDQFRLANYYGVNPNVALRDAVSQAFSHFSLPFHADSIANLPSGDFLDFEFIGNLSLGFGATFGFSQMFFGGLSKGEVSASLATPLGKKIVSAAPSFQVGAAFKVNYAHKDDFRVIVGRTNSGATLYLLSTKDTTTTETESFGLKFSAGTKYRTDAATLKAETQTVASGMFDSKAGALLANKMNGLFDKAATDVSNSVNNLLKGDGKSVQLELIQSQTDENTALFIYDFDFNYGTGAYGVAMNGDYARALSMPGVRLDPRSFVEQVYTRSAGVSLQFFHLNLFEDVNTYIQQNDVSYVGAGVFQIRSEAAEKSISRLFGKEVEADLYFLAQCNNLGQSVSDATVHMKTVFIDTNNASAYGESERSVQTMNLPEVAQAMESYVAHYPKKPLKWTLDVDTASLALIDADDYLPNGKPAPGPHEKDARNYEAFVKAVSGVIGPVDTVARRFETYFGKYSDWVAFNHAANGEEDPSKPGDRLNAGDTNGDHWPDNYPPDDVTTRKLVQSYILAAQQFMNLCAGIKGLLAALPATQTADAYTTLYQAISGMVRKESDYPTFFLKPSIAALMDLAQVRLTVDGALPDPTTVSTFDISLVARKAAGANTLAKAA